MLCETGPSTSGFSLVEEEKKKESGFTEKSLGSIDQENNEKDTGNVKISPENNSYGKESPACSEPRILSGKSEQSSSSKLKGMVSFFELNLF